MSQHKDSNERLTDHDYDGIRELDNDLPLWWLAIFAGTVIFAFIYYVHYEVAMGPSTDQEVAAAMKSIKDSRPVEKVFNEDQLEKLFTTQESTKGQAIFAVKCAACHGPTGGGVIGPNLTDEAWIHGNGQRHEIYNVIAKGVPAMGMPAWAEMMDAGDVLAAAAFVYSIKNTHVSGGKPPQGPHGSN